ncbi:MAG: UvrD-helicase domain-containing protein [Dysgonamonadaceae bacterium]|jgi:superfamily I DNA/RNA helicase|nr:UvrD-helicase domain-containing protein [Dysgonamonadaceae bacterium]
MSNNRLIIAAAGSGKTTRLINEALKIKDKKVLITTYTEANEAGIRKKIIALNKYIPKNVTVQTWFSFLLQHGIRPFQGTFNDVLFEKKVKGLLLVNEQSGLRCKFKKNGKEIPLYYSEKKDFEKHYFTQEMKIFSDKLSKFVVECNKKSNGAVIDRISKIYQHVFIDEVQDLAGNDLEILKLFFNCNSEIILVGDPRQVVYLTHNEKLHSKYSYGKIKEFIQEKCKKNCCSFEDLTDSYRCKQEICDFADNLYPDLPKTKSKNIDIKVHTGIFFVKEQDVGKYLEQYKPIQLRNSMTKDVNEKYPVKNFGEAKGLTFDRVLIYPTVPILKWLKDNNSILANTSRSKFYVAITRAKYSVGIIVENNEQTAIEGITYFTNETTL